MDSQFEIGITRSTTTVSKKIVYFRPETPVLQFLFSAPKDGRVLGTLRLFNVFKVCQLTFKFWLVTSLPLLHASSNGRRGRPC